MQHIPIDTHLFKVKSKELPLRSSSVFIVDFEHIRYILNILNIYKISNRYNVTTSINVFLVSVLLNLNSYLLSENSQASALS